MIVNFPHGDWATRLLSPELTANGCLPLFFVIALPNAIAESWIQARSYQGIAANVLSHFPMKQINCFMPLQGSITKLIHWMAQGHMESNWDDTLAFMAAPMPTAWFRPIPKEAPLSGRGPSVWPDPDLVNGRWLQGLPQQGLQSDVLDRVLEQSIAFHHSERQHMTKMPPQASRKGSPFVFFPHVRRGVTAAAAGGRVIEFTERHLGTEQLPELYRDRCTDVYRASAASEAVRRSEKHAILCDPGALQQAVRERQLAVFFRNSHFNTMLKFDGQLYLLCTDIAFSSSEVVWERFDKVDGDTDYVDAEFRSGQQAAGAVGEAYVPGSMEDADAQLAWQMMQEELDIHIFVHSRTRKPLCKRKRQLGRKHRPLPRRSQRRSRRCSLRPLPKLRQLQLLLLKVESRKRRLESHAQYSEI
eukprot:s4695_g2.t1